MYPNFEEEKKLWKQGYDYVVGLDEAGRGPLAGPVVAAAVCVAPLKEQTNKLEFVSLFGGVNDSKKLSAQQREKFYQLLTTHSDIAWGIGVVSEKIIDEINILEASKLAMKNALEHLYHKSDGRQNYSMQDYLLIDGNFLLHGLDVNQKSIIKGDEKVFSIAAAGIIAKVTRDFIMRQLHDRFPNYGLDLHKGYGTKAHLASLAQFGPSEIHRKTFYPVSVLST